MYTSVYICTCLLYLKIRTRTHREKQRIQYSCCSYIPTCSDYQFMSASHLNCRIFSLGTGFGSASSSCSSLVLWMPVSGATSTSWWASQWAGGGEGCWPLNWGRLGWGGLPSWCMCIGRAVYTYPWTHSGSHTRTQTHTYTHMWTRTHTCKQEEPPRDSYVQYIIDSHSPVAKLVEVWGNESWRYACSTAHK